MNAKAIGNRIHSILTNSYRTSYKELEVNVGLQRFPGETDAQLRDRLQKDFIRGVGSPKFGRVVTIYSVGELRRQKKHPYTEVLYVWVDTQDNDIKRVRLRSINNCSNDQLVNVIRQVGVELDVGILAQTDGEFLLDKLYQELGKRAK